MSFAGEFFSFRDLCSFPEPGGAAGLPVHVGGSSRTAARRAGLRGDGYFPGGRLTAQQRADQVELMRATARQAGRDAGALEHTRWGPMDLSAADLEGYAAAGVTRLVLATGSPDLDGQRAEMPAFAERHRNQLTPEHSATD